MINKYTNKQRGLLAVIMAMVMVFAGAAFVAAEVDATVSEDGKTATVTTSTEFDAAINGDSGYESVETIILDADVTPTITTWQNAVSIDGKGYKIILTATVYINAEVEFKDVKFENKYSTDAEEEDPADKYVSYEIYTYANGNITFTGCEFIGDMNNEHVVTITYGGSATFDNVKFNGKTITVDNIGTVEFKNGCSDLDLNLVKTGATVTLGTDVIIDAVTAQGAIVNLANIEYLDLGTEEWTFKSINDRYNISTIKNGTIKNTSFGTYDGVPGDYRNSNVTLNGVTLNGTTNIIASNDVVASLGGTFTLAKDAVINIDAGCKLLNATIAGNGSSATITAIAGASGLTVKCGSIYFTGSVDATDLSIAASTDDVILENVVITGTGPVDLSKVEIMGSVTIPAGVNVTSTDGIVINENSTLNIGGVITGDVSNNGTLVLTSETAGVTGGNVTGTGTVDTSGIASEGTISGSFDTNTVFDKNQVITATDDVVLVKGTFTFEGTFIIPEGVTITIEKDAGLLIDEYTGKLENNGTIIVQGALTVSDGAKIVNEGTISVEEDDSTATITINSTLLNNGTIYVGEGTSATISKDLLNNGTFENEGTLSSGGNIDNAGTVTLAGTVISNITIYMTSTDAIVTFNGVMTNASSEIVISDSKYKDGSKVFNESESKVTVYLTQKESIEGLDITMQVIKDPSVTASTQYLKQLVIAGSISVAQNVDSPGKFSVAVVTDGDVVVPGDIVLSKNVIVKVNTGTMDIAGTITYTYDGDAFDSASYTSNVWIYAGVMNITGTVSGNAPMMMGKVNAVAYEIEGTSPAPDMYYYTTLAAAAESGAKELKVLGKIDVTSDITIADGVTLDNSEGGITIGKDAKLTLATGSKLKNNDNAIASTATTPACGILVNGTMYIEDTKKTYKAPFTGIASSVQTIGESDALFTNLANALAVAKEGDVIKLSGNAEIKADTTIPAGVTVDTSAYAVKVANDITLTIDGTLLINTSGSFVLTEKDDSVTPVKEAGAVVLNGKIESPVGITNPIAGAYYSITEKGKITYYVEPVANAASKIATVDAYTMTINAFDDELKVGAVSFVGATDTPATVKVVGKIAGDITLDLATINFNGKAFKGTVTNGTGTIALDGTNALTVKSTTKDDVKTLAVSGTFDAADEKTITVTGDVSFDGFNADDVTVDGNVKVVKAGTIGVMTVNGTIAVDNGVTLTVADIEILGTVAVAEADTAASKLAGTLKVTGNAFIGITEKAVVGASASLTGKAVVDEQMFVAAGSSFPADMVKDTPYVELCIEDKTWITVYDFADVGTVTIKADVVENADVTGWVDENGDSVATKVGDKYVIDVVDGKVSAKIDYNIYNVTFVKAAGINDIYVDGVLVGDLATGVKIAAGQHTVSYTLANGYTGEAKMLVDGKEVSGLTFTVGGDDLDYAITLQGIEKAPAEVGGGDAPVADKDEGMDLTDILLIVLVVLIVIMAIIVALRMMRS